MRKYVMLLALIAGGQFYANAQITFDPGYFIQENGDSIICLIRNLDWKNNPQKFEYKLSQTGEVQTASIDHVKAFGVQRGAHFVRATVNLERSETDPNQLSKVRAPEFKEETLFLRILVRGNAWLYLYEEGNIRKYFYSVSNAPIEQLVYKLYQLPDKRIAKNPLFKTQLWSTMQCGNVTQQSVEQMAYNQSELTRFFNKYNACTGSVVKSPEADAPKRKAFELTFRPGIRMTSMKVENKQASDYNVNFGSKVGYRIGMEAQVILPYNKGKWALFAEPTYQSFKAEADNKYTGPGDEKATVNYKSIELPLGVRHYFFLNENARIFVNGAVVFDLKLKSEFYSRSQRDITGSSINFALGAGYKYKRLSTELRYYTSRDVLGTYVSFKTHYNTTALVFGYRLF